MEKRNAALISFLSILLIKFASAYNGYGSFSLGDFFDSIEPSTMILGSLFIIFFAFINFVLSRVFTNRTTGEPNKAIAGIISLMVSLLIVYGINRSGLDVENFFFDIGISGDLLYTIVPIILIIGAIYLIFKYKAKTLLILGLLLILIAGATDLVYEEETLVVFGIILIVIGLIWTFASKKKQKKNKEYQGFGKWK